MKNKIYLTQEGKEEIEEKIKILNEKTNQTEDLNSLISLDNQIMIYEDILFNSIILPVLEDYEELAKNTQDLTYSSVIYPNGVIIKQ